MRVLRSDQQVAVVIDKVVRVVFTAGEGGRGGQAAEFAGYFWVGDINCLDGLTAGGKNHRAR